MVTSGPCTETKLGPLVIDTRISSFSGSNISSFISDVDCILTTIGFAKGWHQGVDHWGGRFGIELS